MKFPISTYTKSQNIHVVLKNRAVPLKQQGGPTNTNRQSMLSNLDHPIILHSVRVFASLMHI